MHRPRRRKRHPLAFPIFLLCAVLLCMALPRFAARLAHNAGTGSPQVANFILPDGTDQEKLQVIADHYPAAKPVAQNPDAYPKELVDLLIRNPETASFVAEYPHGKPKQTKINLKKETTQNGFPHLLQWDARWGYDSYGESTIALSGCGPTCLSMVYIGLTGDTSITPAVLCQKSAENGYYKKGAGTLWALMTEGAKQLGLTSREIPLEMSLMKAELAKGRPLILSLRKGDFTTDGHFIVVTGVDESGEFQILDPNSRLRSQTTWSMDRLKKQINNIWAFTR